MQIFLNRIIFLLAAYKLNSFLWGLALILLSCFVAFPDSPSLGGIILLHFIHYLRTDTILLKLAYAEKYEIILIAEYVIIYSVFAGVSILGHDPLTIYSPGLFGLFIMTIKLIKPALYKNFSLADISAKIIDDRDFIWKAGVRKTQLKIGILTILSSMVMAMTSIPYVYIIYLCLLILVGVEIYKHPIPDYFIEVAKENNGSAIHVIYRRNFVSFIKIISIPTIIQFMIVNELWFAVYSLCGIIVCCIILFQFLLSNLSNRSRQTYSISHLINAFSALAILLPPLAIVLIVYCSYLFKKVNANAGV